MREPSPRTSRLAIGGSLAALIAIGGGGFLLGRATVHAPAPITERAPAPVSPTTSVPPPERTLQRADLIALVASAADSVASGRTLPRNGTDLVGKRFVILLPFGCDGPAPDSSDASMRWQYDEKAAVLRVTVAPVVWAKAEWWQEPPETVEEMEGFWIERPWSSLETCPSSSTVAAAPGADPVTLPGQTLGVVQLISPDTPRQMVRGGKPYEAVIRKISDAAQLAEGLQLRLKGRIGRFPNDQPVRCKQPGGREQRPVCLVAVTIDELAFRNPATGETISVWQPTVDVTAGDSADE